MSSICPRCKALIKEEDNYCGDCGLRVRQPVEISPVTENVDPRVSKIEIAAAVDEIPVADDRTVSDEILIKTYIGNNYERLNNGIFSLAALFFGPLCFLNRKMYLAGIIMAGIIHLSFLIHRGVWAFVFLFLHIVCGVSFKLLYFRHAGKEVDKIKRVYPESGKVYLLNECRKRGGKNAFIVLIDILLGIALFGVVSINY